MCTTLFNFKNSMCFLQNYTYVKSVLFLDIIQSMLLNPYRRLGTTYPSHLQEYKFPFPWKWDGEVIPKRR